MTKHIYCSSCLNVFYRVFGKYFQGILLWGVSEIFIVCFLYYCCYLLLLYGTDLRAVLWYCLDNFSPAVFAKDQHTILRERALLLQWTRPEMTAGMQSWGPEWLSDALEPYLVQVELVTLHNGLDRNKAAVHLLLGPGGRGTKGLSRTAALRTPGQWAADSSVVGEIGLTRAGGSGERSNRQYAAEVLWDLGTLCWESAKLHTLWTETTSGLSGELQRSYCRM